MHSWTAKSALTSLQPSWLIRDELPLSPIVALLEICEQYQAAASAYDLDALLDNRLAALKAAVAALPSSQDSPESSPCVGSESAESVANSRGQAQSHMDRSLVAAYLAMLIGLLARSSSSSRLALCNALGENSLKNMLRLLNYFLSFLKMAVSNVCLLSSVASHRVVRPIAYLEIANWASYLWKCYCCLS